ncbi:Hypothetical_protein [Hexamita inflata]|uniref:Hypothetical_protein n=1 Tax=Hexamita inflata TaxID=28002 RepID=A0ABP1KQ10_9EUKA
MIKVRSTFKILIDRKHINSKYCQNRSKFYYRRCYSRRLTASRSMRLQQQYNQEKQILISIQQKFVEFKWQYDKQQKRRKQSKISQQKEEQTHQMVSSQLKQLESQEGEKLNMHALSVYQMEKQLPITNYQNLKQASNRKQIFANNITIKQKQLITKQYEINELNNKIDFDYEQQIKQAQNVILHFQPKQVKWIHFQYFNLQILYIQNIQYIHFIMTPLQTRIYIIVLMCLFINRLSFYRKLHYKQQLNKYSQKLNNQQNIKNTNNILNFMQMYVVIISYRLFQQNNFHIYLAGILLYQYTLFEILTA